MGWAKIFEIVIVGGLTSASLGRETSGSSTLPKKSSLVKRFSSNT